MSEVEISKNSFHYEVYAQGSVEPDFTSESAEEVLKKWMELDNPSVIYLTAGKAIEGKDVNDIEGLGWVLVDQESFGSDLHGWLESTKEIPCLKGSLAEKCVDDFEAAYNDQLAPVKRKSR